MPYPKDIRRFPEKWLEMFDWFEEHPDTPFVLECESPKRAHSMRFQFYRAREVMRKDEELKRAYINTDKREAVLEGSKVVFRFKDATPAADLLRKSIEENEKRVEGKE